MSPEDLIKMGVRADRAKLFANPITAAMQQYHIDTPARRAAFLSQILHESGMLRHVREIWGPTDTQTRYEGRKDLGNVMPGDGFRFRGRGLLQLTGRENYQRVSNAFGIDFIGKPHLLEDPMMAARVSAWWWQARGLNELSDEEAIDKVSRRINGGTNGLAERLAIYDKAREVLA